MQECNDCGKRINDEVYYIVMNDGVPYIICELCVRN
jgi:hypothetical protein